MKPHKHARLIHAWADGEQIQVRHRDDIWRDVLGVPSWMVTSEYRIKPKEYEMSEADWQCVIDEGYLCKAQVYDHYYKLDCIPAKEHVQIVREKGIRQPHFKGDKHPEGDAKVVVTSWDDETFSCLLDADDVSWNMVKEYIVLSEG